MMKNLILLCALALPAVLHAQTPRTWVGGTGNWSVPGNWSPNGVPAAIDNASIANGITTLDQNGETAAFSFTGGSLRGEVIPAGAPRTLTVGGLLTLDAGGGTIGTGQMMTIQANAGISLRYIQNLNGVTLNLANSQTCTDFGTHGSNSGVSNGTIINNAGTWNATGTSGLGSSGTASTFNNSGIFNRSVNGGEWFTAMSFNNTGTVNVNTGILRLAGGGASSGAFDVSSGALLTFGGIAPTTFTSAASFTGAGMVKFEINNSAAIDQYNITGGTTVTSGTVTFNNGAGDIGAVTLGGSGGTAHFNGTASPTALTVNSGTANFANNVTLPAGATVNGGNVIMAATKSLTIPGMLNWTGGTLGGGGGTIHANGGITSASGASRVDAATLVLPIGATMTQSGSNTLELRNGATWTNAGTFLAQVGSSISSGAGVNAFTNTGTFTRSGVGVSYFVSVPFHNNGIVNANVGTLTLNNGGNSPGLFNIGTGATLQLNGAHTLSGSTAFAGAGTVSFGSSLPITLTNYDVTGGTTITSGTVTLNNVAGSIGAVTMSGGTANFNGTTSPTAYTVNGGTAIFANNITVPTATINGGVTNVPATKTFQINGAVTWTGGTLTGGGAFIADGNVTASSGSNTLNGATFQLAMGRTLTQSSGNTLNLSNGAVFTNAGTLVATASNSLNSGGGATSAFNNTGTFTRSTAGVDYNVGVPFNNSGTVNASSGVIRMVTQTFTQTAGSLVLNGGAVRAAFNLPLLIQGGSITGAGNVLGGVTVTGGTVKPRGILAIQDTDSGTTKGDLTMTAASTLDVELGGMSPGGGHDQVTEQGNVAFARNGQLVVRFKNGFHQTVGGGDTFTILTSNQNTTGQFANVSGGRVDTADYKGSFAVNAAGTTSVVLSNFQAYPDLDVQDQSLAQLEDGVSTVTFGGSPHLVGSNVPRTFTISNSGRAVLNNLDVTISGTNAGDYVVTTDLPGDTLGQGSAATFTVTFTPSGSGLRTAQLHIASDDPNEAPFDITLNGTGNYAPVLNMPGSPMIVNATSGSGANVTFTVTATDAEDDPDPTPIISHVSGSLFPVGDTTVNVSATDSAGFTTNGSFIVRVVIPAPTVATLVPSPLNTTTATLRGTVNSNNFGGYYYLYLDNVLVSSQILIPSNDTMDVNFPTSGLLPGSAHTCRLDAQLGTEPLVTGNTVNFTMLGGPPSVTTSTPTMVTPTRATLTATVNPNLVDTTVTFYVGGIAVGTANVPAGTDPQTVSFNYTTLIPGQSLVYTASATNTAAQNGNGTNQNFNLMPSDSTIGSANNYLYAANAGWINAKPATSYGFRTSDTTCSGFLYAANFGWIHAGTGEPANGQQYSNTGSDYGINVMLDGTLRGYAWSGNIGWITFEAIGNPRINFVTGALEGYAWSGNIGWINLSTATTTQLAILDTDGDGISDAWELEAAGNLTTLAADRDSDGDGVSDLDEFIADTDPANPGDRSKVADEDMVGGHFIMTFPSTPTRLYRIETALALAPPWTDVGLGWFQGSATGHTIADLGDPPENARFYRVAVKRPLSP